uniref:protein-L-isoaspartate(D-aspartate) O-methyltransferase n=2 Tax=Trichobilharzia regenti TaxID=157069 RepID=A0AA85IXH8_TRIRE|nr:unnamed protein product [Trichobilharzia regenti]
MTLVFDTESGFLKTQAAKISMAGVDRACFINEEPYENKSKSVNVGRHPSSVIFPAPYIHAMILDALGDGIKKASHALVVEQGIGYMTACTVLMTGRDGVTVSAQPTGDLFSNASLNFKKWLQHSKRTYTYGIEVGRQIGFVTYDNHEAKFSNAKYNAIFVREERESDVDRWIKHLKTGGRMVCLVGPTEGEQELYQLDLLTDFLQKKILMTFKNFVPIATRPKEEVVIKPRRLGSYSLLNDQVV